jgi:hypothetical protein
MRAVFTVDVPTVDGKYPTNDEFLTRLRNNGWEDVKLQHLDEDEKQRKYQELAKDLFSDMPELANEEKEYVIFYGVLQDNQTKFIVTRRITGQATFRLLQPALGRLQRSTEKMIRQLVNPSHHDKPLSVSYQSVFIYERGHEDVIIRGRIIPKPIWEAWRIDRKNIFLSVGSFLLVVPVIALQLFISTDEHRVIGGNLERLSTALLTTLLVSVLGFYQTYVEIKKNKIIAWTVGYEQRELE